MKNLNYKLRSGTDEAGRGSIIGPLVIACVSADKNTIRKFSRIGIKDSKKITPRNRKIFTEIIIENAIDVSIKKISPQRIDKAVILRKEFLKKKNKLYGKKIIGLNELEAYSMAKIIDNLDSEIIYVDSCDTNPNKFKERIIKHTKNKIKIYSRHKADELYVIVSAASIIAKHTRDMEIIKLRKKYGNIGSGYPSDHITRAFLRNWVLKNQEIPDFARKSWKTWLNLQPKIDDYV